MKLSSAIRDDLQVIGVVLLVTLIISIALPPQALAITSTVATVTATAGPGGTISPSGSVQIGVGACRTFTITPNAGFSIADVLVDGNSVGAVPTFNLCALPGTSTRRTIEARFVANFTITASAGSGGSISPWPSLSVGPGVSASFTITPDAGFIISDVLVDGTSVGAVPMFVFEDVRENHTIVARFIAGWTITASAEPGGTILPAGAVSVNSGASQKFTITPDAGFIISDVLVDGTSVGAVSTFTFTNVTADRTIEAHFLEVFPAIAPALQLLLDDD